MNIIHRETADIQPLPGTGPITAEGDLAAQMVAGIDRFLAHELEASVEGRARYWGRDLSSHEAYVRSIEPNRQRFRKIIGLADPREVVEMVRVETLTPSTQPVAPVRSRPLPSPLPSFDHPACRSHGVETHSPVQDRQGERGRMGYTIHPVRWNALKGVDAEGLLLLPDGEAIADVVALPDCDWTPEMLVGLTPGVPKKAQFARRLAEQGCRVLVPVLIDRRDVYSGISGVRMTNYPHREFIYRAAYEMGRHIVGYEVQKALAGVDWFVQSHDVGAVREPPLRNRPIGVVGYGEGGLIAFYAGAVDVRIDAVGVSGYFQPREGVWREPIYRNVFGLLDEFGDAEIAGLIAPRALVIEACGHPEVTGPPPPSPERSGAAPGALTTPSVESVGAEFERARGWTGGLSPPAPLKLVKSRDGSGLPGSRAMLTAFLKGLGTGWKPASLHTLPKLQLPDPEARLKRQFEQLAERTQHLMREAEFRRAEFWSKADYSGAEKWREGCKWYRDYLRDEVIGCLPPPTLPAASRTRLIYDEPKFTGYEVALDVYPDVFAYGVLLAPKGIQEGERRPVVVCQHGLEGRPQDVADPKVDNPHYHRFACRLAERGFVAYAPQNPYIGRDSFRVLQRKANPLKLSLFSFIVRQHERTLAWLSSLPFVDPGRIAFYGLSYGGKTAMRVPALLEQYCLSICSADYNEWIWKNVSTRHRYTYMITGEYEMPEFNLGNTFNYAEMSWLIFPRPFMVERGHHDGVAPDEWVAYEYARTFRRYNLLGIGDRTEIEFFDGPHAIHGVGTFRFLHRHLRWPEPSEAGGRSSS